MTSFNRKWKSAVGYYTQQTALKLYPTAVAFAMGPGDIPLSELTALTLEATSIGPLLPSNSSAHHQEPKSYTITAETKGAASFTEPFPK